MSALVGFYFISMDHSEYSYRTGVVKAQLAPDTYLVAFDLYEEEKGIEKGLHEVVSNGELTKACDDCGSKLWSFYSDKVDLDRLVQALQSADKPEKKDNVHRLRPRVAPPPKKDK